MKSPVAFFAFNRPDLTRESLQSVVQYDPPILFLIADGPRPNNRSDEDKCAEVRYILDRCSIPGTIIKHYASSNIGLKQRFKTGLDLVFKQVAQAIIVEDDCLPCQEFFHFCHTMLTMYADDARVWFITGNNFQNGIKRGRGSYYFSNYLHIWGWATWRRIWKYYDSELSEWPTWRKSSEWLTRFESNEELEYWNRVFDDTYSGRIATWDFQLLAAALFRGGLTLTPQANLVTNLGFRGDATHTKGASHLATLPIGRLRWPIVNPKKVRRHMKADQYAFRNVFLGIDNQGKQPRLSEMRARIAQYLIELKRRLLNG